MEVGLMPNTYFNGKICIVTGANSGIGYALSEELLKRGATVFMAGRDPKKVAKAAGQLAAYGNQVRTLIVDVTNRQQVEKAVRNTAAKGGRLDMLFNNAGVGHTGSFEKDTLADWKAVIDTNLWSVIYGIHAAVPIMLRQGFGHIVNTSSIGGLTPPPFQSLYNTTKYAITGLTESLRYEYAEQGICFSALCPAFIATAIFSKGLDGSVGEQKIPEGAYPADKAASYSLDRVAERKGIIVVPEEPYTTLWKGYATGDQATEKFLLTMAQLRRKEAERGEAPQAVPPFSS
jgi:NAD(P)-dependent dehydrogenase (short-subunit alcohol dehydrogenase family)